MEIVRHGCFFRAFIPLFVVFIVVIHPIFFYNPLNLYKINIEDEKVYSRSLISPPSTEKVLRFYYDKKETCSIPIKATLIVFLANVACICIIKYTTESKLKQYASRYEERFPPSDNVNTTEIEPE
jgi:hypothetical protein